MKILITNGIIITLGENCSVLYDHDLLIENGIIQKIAAKNTIQDSFDKIIDAKNKVVLPGFINAHMHFYSTLVRGFGETKSAQNFQGILENLWWQLDKQLTLEDIYMSTLIILLNAIRHGTTTIIDHHASPNAVKGSLYEIARAIKECGLRGCLCYELSDRDGEKVAAEGIAENIEFIKFCQENSDDQLKALFGLHASFTINEATLEKAAQAGHDLNAGFHVHTAEGLSDQEKTIAMCGQRIVERFNRHGILGSQTIAAHCVHIDDHEMDLLAQTDTIIVHNPQSNMNNGVGIADIIKQSARGILVGLGTDAMTVNMTEEVRVALWAQHLRTSIPSAGFMDAANTLFLNNAKITERIWDDAKIGVLQEGYAADIVLIDYIPPTTLDNNTVLGHLIFGVSQSTVDTTIVKGRVLMENKVLKLDIDEEEVSAKSRELAGKLWKRF